MTSTAPGIIEVTHRLVDGYHIFTCEEVGLYVADKDAEKAFNSVAPSVQKLVKLNTGLDCVIEAAMNFTEFLQVSRESGEDAVPHPSVISSRSFIMRPAA